MDFEFEPVAGIAAIAVLVIVGFFIFSGMFGWSDLPWMYRITIVVAAPIVSYISAYVMMNR